MCVDGKPPTHIFFLFVFCHDFLMPNVLDIDKMYRETYQKTLLAELQQKLQKYTPFLTYMGGCTGKFVEFNGIGKTEIQFRKNKYEDKEPEESTYSKRSMRPIGLAKALRYSEDDKILKGDFSVSAEDFIQQMSYAFNRGIDSVVLGVVKDEAKKKYVIAPPADDDITTQSFYKGGALGGILGTNYIGEALVKPETMPIQPMLGTGVLAASHTQVENPEQVDLVQTNVIPYNWVRTGSMVGSSLTLEKVLALREALEARDALEDGEMVNLAITTKMKYDLIADARLQDKDLGFQTLKDGLMSEILGVRFLVTNKVPVVNIASASEEEKWVYACPAWKTEDVVYGFWDNLAFDIVKPSMSYDEIIISGKCALGCARKRKESVIMVLCDTGLSFA